MKCPSCNNNILYPAMQKRGAPINQTMQESMSVLPEIFDAVCPFCLKKLYTVNGANCCNPSLLDTGLREQQFKCPFHMCGMPKYNNYKEPNKYL